MSRSTDDPSPFPLLPRLGLWAGAALMAVLPAVAPAIAQSAVCDGVSPSDNTTLKSVAVVTGLSGRPLYVTAPPGDRDRLFIVEQDGFIWVKHRGTAPSDVSLFLDISDRVWTGVDNEAGLLGLAFDPDHADNGRFYVYYFAGSGFFTCTTNCRTVVSEFTTVAGNPDAGDPASEQILLTLSQPQNNHNGGQLLFGADGFLYVFTGDGGGSNDSGTGHAACGNGQSLETLLGKILRLDVRGVDPSGTPPDTTCMSGYTASGFTVPSSNPFADGPGNQCDEIWAYGLRNPWRNAFDPLNDDLYVADVGQNCWEEIDYTAAADAPGTNYGWRSMEGTHCFDPANAGNCNPPGVNCSGAPPCNDPSLEIPVVEFDHASGACSVTGGFVYRGCKMPNFDGTYFYGDFCAGFIRSIEIVNGAPTNAQDWTSQLDPGGQLANALTSFGVDAEGEHYIVNRDGEIWKILPPFPDLEVSGRGAGQPFLLNRDGNWTWEDLEFTTMHPVDFYRVYRGVPAGTFECIHSTRETGWVQGDTTTPAPGALLAYLVTAVSPDGEESSGGDPPRTLTNPCPAPP